MNVLGYQPRSRGSAEIKKKGLLPAVKRPKGDA